MNSCPVCFSKTCFVLKHSEGNPPTMLGAFNEEPDRHYKTTKYTIMLLIKLFNFLQTACLPFGIPIGTDIMSTINILDLTLTIMEHAEAGDILFRQRVNHFLRAGKID